MADDRLLYCAFGSTMSTRYLRDHRPAAEPLMPTAPGNFRTELRRYSANPGGGIGTIQPASGEIVQGLPDDHLAPHRGLARRIVTAGP